MRNLVTVSAAVLVLAAVSTAQAPSCGLAGVTVDISPPNPALGEQIDVTITNNSAQTISLPNSCLYTGVFPSADCSGNNLDNQFCLTIVIPIAPGGNYVVCWDQQNSMGQQVPSGTYSFRVRYFDSSGTNLTCCVPFSIGSTTTGTSHCFGDGGDQMGCTDCPCGNNTVPGTNGGCLNSAGTATRLLSSGSTSVSTADLRFEASGMPPNNSAVLTSGNALAPANMANPCFGQDSGIQSVSLDGLRCVVQGVLRHGVRPSDMNGDVGVTTNGWGTPNGFFNFAAFTAGDTKHFQIIHRDDAGAVCMTGQNTSQAASVTFTL